MRIIAMLLEVFRGGRYEVGRVGIGFEVEDIVGYCLCQLGLLNFDILADIPATRAEALRFRATALQADEAKNKMRIGSCMMDMKKS